MAWAYAPLPEAVNAHLNGCPNCQHILKWAEGFEEWAAGPTGEPAVPPFEVPLGLAWGTWMRAGESARGWRFDLYEHTTFDDGTTTDVLCYREWLPLRESLRLRDDLLKAFPLDRYPRLEDL